MVRVPAPGKAKQRLGRDFGGPVRSDVLPNLEVARYSGGKRSNIAVPAVRGEAKDLGSRAIADVVIVPLGGGERAPARILPRLTRQAVLTELFWHSHGLDRWARTASKPRLTERPGPRTLREIGRDVWTTLPNGKSGIMLV